MQNSVGGEVYMSLAIEVGLLADLLENDPEGAEMHSESLKVLNEFLEERGLPLHQEPEVKQNFDNRCSCKSFPYLFLHYLRRFYAMVVTYHDWEPEPLGENEDPSEDLVVEEESLMFESHLLCHSDCEGFYLPIDFDEIICDEDARIEGGMLCSSYRLYDELLIIAPKLGIQLLNSSLLDEEVERINKRIGSQDGFWRELCVWLALFEAARISIEHGVALCFC